MSVHTSGSLGRLLSNWLTPPLFLLTPVGCGSDTATLPANHDSALLSAQAPRAATNPVLHWNALASELMIDPGPVIDSRAYTIMQASVHDAVNAIERRYTPYTADLSAPGASVDAAVAAAARTVLLEFSPSQREKIEAAYKAALSTIPRGKAREQGVVTGERAARANIARRASDAVPVEPFPPTSGPITQPVFVPTGAPGDYAFTPPFNAPPMGPIALFPGWGNLPAFAANLTKYHTPGPPALSSEAYARDVNRVKAVGGVTSATRTADEAETAFFWFEDFVIWNNIANTVLTQQHADTWDAARVLLLMHLAVVDAGIANFREKYRHRFWRPLTAIARADEDSNPRTTADTTFVPLLSGAQFFTPPIPEYPSAAATVASAAAEVLLRHLGDQHTFEATSVTAPGVRRRYTSFSQAATETGQSRIFGGIHFPAAVRDGHQLGKSIAADVSAMLPAVRR